jgi:Ca2+-binding RTX toxin-like protein
MSGDRGSDTLAGDAGADRFNFFVGAGLDRVVDFNRAEGDYVTIEGGAAYTLSQAGSDTVVSLGVDDQLVLAGVQLSSLGTGWILAI